LLEVKMFGTFKIFKDDKLIDNSFGSHKAEELFKFLLLNKNKRISTYELYDFFWNDFIDQNAKQNLNSTLYYIRKKLGISKEELFIKNDICFFRPKNIRSDVEEFSNIVKDIDESVSEDEDNIISFFEELDSVYSGILLPDNLRDIWVEEKRFYFQNLYIDKLIDFVDILFKRFQTDKALKYIDKGLSKNRKREDLWLKKIEFLIKLENFSLAKKTQSEYRKIFGDQDIDFINLTLENFSNFNKIDQINNFSNILGNNEGGTTLNKKEFDFALELEKKKRKKDFFFLEIEIDDNSNILDLYNILSKNIRREDLINKNRNKIYILFRGLELPKENKDVIVDKLSKFTEKVTENFKILKFE